MGQPAAVPGSPGEPGLTEPFVDATRSAGLYFQHINGMPGEFYFSEMVGGGVALCDYDNDGDLDVYLVQGHLLGPDMEPGDASFEAGLQGPLTDRLYRNDLDGGSLGFADVTTASGLDARGYGMGVATADLDGNGWIDIYVANDLSENRSWMNQGDGTFRNTGLFNGSALNDAGDFDFDGDGDEDLFVSHLVTQTNTLSVNDGTGLFEDQSVRTGLGPPSLPFTGFGTAWFDYDNDGWLV